MYALGVVAIWGGLIAVLTFLGERIVRIPDGTSKDVLVAVTVTGLSTPMMVTPTIFSIPVPSGLFLGFALFSGAVDKFVEELDAQWHIHLVCAPMVFLFSAITLQYITRSRRYARHVT